jgi:FkbM family methyltransferase
VSPRDRRGRELVFSKGAFNAATIEIWRKIIKKRHWTHVVDIGANYGEMLLSVDMPATAKIIVVEPSPRIVPYLEYSLSSAGIPARLFQCAVSDHDGESCLLIDREWSGTSRLGTVPGCPESVSDDIHKLEPITVPTVTLSSILNEPDSAHMTVLIKIDVEGHEISILRGSISAIQKIGYFCALIEILHLPAECLEWLLRHFEVRLATVGGVHFEPVVPNTVATFRRMIETESFHTQDAVIVHRAAG